MVNYRPIMLLWPSVEGLQQLIIVRETANLV